MANFMSIEMSEHRYPLQFAEYAIREDSGGAGRYQGGCGTQYRFTTRSECVVSALGDRVDHVPFGIAGGGSAAPSVVRFGIAGKEMTPPMRSKIEKQRMNAGDWLAAASPGGGGFGNPLDRDFESVERDLNLGYISRRTAEETYGAVVSERKRKTGAARYTVDLQASARKRAELKGETSRPAAAG
jgi:N-methylhydantoinase B